MLNQLIDIILRSCVFLKFFLQARMQEMKEKELKYTGNGDANSHVCKVCFESPTATMLLPCRHFCCKFFVPEWNTCNFHTNLHALKNIYLQYASHAPWPALNVQSAEQRFQIGFSPLLEVNANFPFLNHGLVLLRSQ